MAEGIIGKLVSWVNRECDKLLESNARMMGRTTVAIIVAKEKYKTMYEDQTERLNHGNWVAQLLPYDMGLSQNTTHSHPPHKQSQHRDMRSVTE